jgi:gliding motility-associated-like protein
VAFNVGTLSPITISITASSQTTCIESNFPKFSKPVKLTATGAQNFVWFPYNPLNMTYSLGPQTDVRPSATTIYTVIGSTSVCANSQTLSLTVIPQFTMNVVPPLPAMCLGDSVKLSIVNIHTLAVGPVSAFTYSWTEPGNAPPISLSNNLTSTVMAFPQNTATYTVEVKDSRKCISLPRLVTVTVLPRPLTSISVPTINSVATNSVCYVGLNPGARDVTIDLMAVNGNQNLQFGVVPTYTWLQPYDNKHNSILTPSNSPGVTVSAPVKMPSIVVYTLISGYNGVPGCKRMDTVSVRVVDCRPVRDVKFVTTEVNDTICARNCITFQSLTDTMAGGPQKLVWQFPGGSPNTSTVTIPTICYNLPGKYNVILGVSNPYPISSGGSSLTIGQLGFVKVVDVPNVTIIAPGQERSDTTVRFGTAVRLEGKGAITYEWAPNYNITSLTNPKVTVSPFKTTQYILTGYNSKHCTSSDTLNVIVIEDCGEMYVPNAFSPNNDGANDVLYVRGICLESLTFMVFNRWGEKVFETNDQKIGWDGTYKGEQMNTGVFVYRLEGKTYDGKGFSLKGNITLIR